MNEQNKQAESPPKRREAAKDGASRAELLRVVFDFVSKCFYPAIVIYVIVLLRPVLAEIDLKALVSRLQSARAGDYEFTFGQAEDVGATTAPLNNKIAELERTVAVLVTDLNALQENSGTPVVSEAVQQQRAEQQKRFEENSRYTVLVFHGSAARSRADAITTALLAAGYTASSTETDFNELRKTHPAGTVYITHSKAGEAVYGDVEAVIADLDVRADLKVQQTTTDLRRGEVQVLVF